MEFNFLSLAFNLVDIRYWIVVANTENGYKQFW